MAKFASFTKGTADEKKKARQVVVNIDLIRTIRPSATNPKETVLSFSGSGKREYYEVVSTNVEETLKLILEAQQRN